MKKILKIFFLISIFSLVGCGAKSADNILEKLEKKLENANSYYLEGIMEIMNNEDTYTYDVKVSYQKPDYYKIELINTLNNHEQVILRNDDGVYVVTPSLNKSFKFQSDWPYNNSQVYLLNSILSDLKEDENREYKTKDDGYYFSSIVNYPNNKSLAKQKVYINKDASITKTEVVDKDDNVQIVMNFNKQEYNKKFDKNYFELSELLDISNSKKDTTPKNNNTSDNDNNDNNNYDNDTNNEDNTKTTATIDDIIYPMYLPNNTYLTSQEIIDTDNGQRLILTFSGDSSFILVEETTTTAEEGLIIPVSGDFDFLSDVIGIVGTNSLSWHSNGIDYYIVSDTITTAELVEIANSVSILPVSK